MKKKVAVSIGMEEGIVLVPGRDHVTNAFTSMLTSELVSAHTTAPGENRGARVMLTFI